MVTYFNLISVEPETPTGSYLVRGGVWDRVFEMLKQRKHLIPFRQVVPLDMEARVRTLAKLGPKSLKYFQELVQSSTGIDLRRWFNVPGCNVEEFLSKKNCTWGYLLALGLGRFQPKTREFKATNLAFHPQIQFLTGLTTKYEM